MWESQELNPAPSDPGALTDIVLWEGPEGNLSDGGKQSQPFIKQSFSTLPAHRVHLGSFKAYSHHLSPSEITN